MTEAATLEAPETLKALKSFKLFEGVAEDIVRELAAHSRIVEFAERDCIFRENDVAQHVYLIVSGRVSLVICRPNVGCRQLMDLGAGELLGWSPLVQRPRLSATARAREATKAIEIDGQQLARMCRHNPTFFCDFMSRVAQIVAERLSATRLQLLEMSGIRLPEVTIESD